MKKKLSLVLLSLLVSLSVLFALCPALAAEEETLPGTWVLDENALYTSLAMQYGMNMDEARASFGEYRATYIFNADGTYMRELSAARSFLHEEGTYTAEYGTVLLYSDGAVTQLTFRFERGRLLISDTEGGMVTVLIRAGY